MFKRIRRAFGTKDRKKKSAEPAKRRVKKAAKTGKAKTAAASDHADTPPTQAPAKPADDRIEVRQPTEREKLIEEALAIHREKSKMLDDLPPAARTKLTAMAMAVYIKQRSANDKKS